MICSEKCFSPVCLNFSIDKRTDKRSRSTRVVRFLFFSFFLTERCIELHYTLKAYNFRLMQKFCHLFSAESVRCVCTSKGAISRWNCINSAQHVSAYYRASHVSKWQSLNVYSSPFRYTVGIVAHHRVMNLRNVKQVSTVTDLFIRHLNGTMNW